MGEKCKVSKCEKEVFCKGYCSVHYNRQLKGIDMELNMHKKNEIIRINEKHSKVITYDKDRKEKYNFIIDNEDVEFARKHKWYINNDNFALSHFRDKLIYFHKEVLNCKEDMEVDHIDRNRLNCSKSNLRKCTRIQNSRNRGVQKNNSSGITVVHYDKKTNRWCVQIKNKYEGIWLGGYKDKKDAIKIRLKAEQLIFGDYSSNVHRFSEIEDISHIKSIEELKDYVKVGAKMGNQKLTKEDVIKIRELGETMTAKEICEVYPVKEMAIKRILNRTSWKKI